ncbi:hypothetical protein E4T66_17890 [Sinimarinibacterium sp. CAU 1509]|uniref:hypothetical protein n=1 Tax=Sinimarinibacterium sp. CAU 1509 TaxID=2562283 RepID=UPI0010AD7601|nr:hypothetical protein [Sinimarinibacterium sp. CAU 1509]TJY57277.1 hypothetical protein E4T66_17890 [Sinimarinibacterium sp. CAU 1509]
MNLQSQLTAALRDVYAVEQSRRHQLAVETLAQAKYLRERGDVISAYAVLHHALAFHGLSALQKQVDQAKVTLVEQFGDKALSVANRAAIAVTRAAQGGDCAQLAREVANVALPAKKLPVVPDIQVSETVSLAA